MGRWLDRLRISEKIQPAAKNEPLKTFNPYFAASFEGFEGSNSEEIPNFSHQREQVEGSPSGLRRTLGAAAPCATDAQDLDDAFQERAAILQYDAGLTRAEAEALAWQEVYTQYNPRK